MTVARQFYPGIPIVIQEGRGKGAAIRTGFAAATGDIIVLLDADGSTDPAEIPAFIGTLIAGADFAKGSRFLQGGGTANMTCLRRLGNRFFVFQAKLVTFSAGWDILRAIVKERLQKPGKHAHVRRVVGTTKKLLDVMMAEIALQNQTK